MEQKIINIKANSRLHIALIDLEANYSSRVDGGFGFFIENPHFEATLKTKSTDEIEIYNTSNTKLCKELYSDIKVVLVFTKEKFKFKGVILNINNLIPQHSGFGSKTQTLMSVIFGYCKLNDISLDNIEIAKIAGRGGTSGIGTNGFFSGGAIIDCGHSFKIKNNLFKPSSYSKTIPPPPVVCKLAMPNWPMIIVTPNVSNKFSQNSEKSFFSDICPIPLADVQYCSHIVLMMIIPSIIENDLETFCSGIDRIQELYWNRAEIKAQASIVRETMLFMKKIGLMGVGISSMGPTVYGFHKNMIIRSDVLLNSIQDFLTENGGVCFLSSPINKGINYKITKI